MTITICLAQSVQSIRMSLMKFSFLWKKKMIKGKKKSKKTCNVPMRKEKREYIWKPFASFRHEIANIILNQRIGQKFWRNFQTAYQFFNMNYLGFSCTPLKSCTWESALLAFSFLCSPPIRKHFIILYPDYSMDEFSDYSIGIQTQAQRRKIRSIFCMVNNGVWNKNLATFMYWTDITMHSLERTNCIHVLGQHPHCDSGPGWGLGVPLS